MFWFWFSGVVGMVLQVWIQGLPPTLLNQLGNSPTFPKWIQIKIFKTEWWFLGGFLFFFLQWVQELIFKEYSCVKYLLSEMTCWKPWVGLITYPLQQQPLCHSSGPYMPFLCSPCWTTHRELSLRPLSQKEKQEIKAACFVWKDSGTACEEQLMWWGWCNAGLGPGAQQYAEEDDDLCSCPAVAGKVHP